MKVAVLLLPLFLFGCGESNHDDTQTAKDMKDGFTARPDPSTLPPDQQKRAAEMKAMAARMAAGGSRAGGGKP